MNDNIVKDIANIIVKRFEPDKVYLFGSYARGEQRIDSDLDFLIVIQAADRNDLWNIAAKIRCAVADYDIEKDIIVVNSELLEKFGEDKQYLYHRVLEEGKLLYEKHKQAA